MLEQYVFYAGYKKKQLSNLNIPEILKLEKTTLLKL